MVFCLMLREWYPGPFGGEVEVGGCFFVGWGPQHPHGRIGLGFLENFTTHTGEGVEPPEDGTKRQKSTRKQKIPPSRVLELMLI